MNEGDDMNPTLLEHIKKHAWTQHLMKDGISKHGENVLYVPGSEFSVKADDKTDGSMIIEGWFSTSALDSYNEIVLPSAFESSLDAYLNDPLLMFMHDWWGMPIGKVLEAEIRPEGLYGKAKVIPTEGESGGKNTIMLINENLLRRFSIGFRIRKWEMDEDSGIMTITDLELLENSVVNLGANPHAIFQIAKKKNLTINIPHEFPSSGGQKRKESGMDPEVKKALDALKKQFGGLTTSLDAHEASVTELKGLVNDRERLVNIVNEEATKLAKGLITQTDYNSKATVVAEDILKLSHRIDTIENVGSVRKTKYPVKDFRALSGEYQLLHDDRGKALPPNLQKMAMFMQADVDLKVDNAITHDIKLMRDAWDACYLASMYYSSESSPMKLGFSPTKLKYWDQMTQLIGQYDPEFAKAMSTEGTGYGAELLLIGMSSEIIDLMEIRPSIANIFKTKIMRANPLPFKLKTSRSRAYVAGEATVDNPDVMKRSKIGYEESQFSVFKIATHVPWSEELEEDAFIDVVTEFREDIAESQDIAKDNICVNGDTTTVHRDTNQGYEAGVDPETQAMGLRYDAIDLSATFDTQSVTLGDATSAYHEKDSRHLQAIMTPGYAVQTSKVHRVVNVKTWIQMKSFEAVANAANRGAFSTFQDGQLDSLDGNPIHLTEALSSDLNTTGVDDGGNPDHSVEILVHEDGYKWGQKRGLTLKFYEDVKTDQKGFVATQRIDWQRQTQTGVKPVAMGLNIETP